MTDNDSQIERRSVLKTLGGIGVAGAIGGGALATFGGGAAANGHVDFGYGSAEVSSNDGTVEYVAIHGDSKITWDGFDTPAESAQILIDVEVADGDGTEVYTTLGDTSSYLHDTGIFALDSSWGGLGEEITTQDAGREGTIISDVGYADDGNGDNVRDETTDWDIVAPGGDPTQGSNDYAIPQNPVPSSELTVDSGETDDGTNDVYTITLHKQYIWYDADDTELLSETFTADVSVDVTNEASTSSGDTNTQDNGATAE